MMNKTEFLAALRRELGFLPKDELDDAIRYYDEYINDAGDDEALHGAFHDQGQTRSDCEAADLPDFQHPRGSVFRRYFRAAAAGRTGLFPAA